MNTLLPYRLCCLILLSVVASSLYAKPFADNSYHLDTLLATKTPLALPGIRLYALKKLRHFYQARDYHAVWTYRQSLNGYGKLLWYTLQHAWREGLQASDYHVDLIKACLQAKFRQACHQGDIELLLSDAFVRYAQHVRHGRFKPDDIDPEWYIKAPPAWNPLETLTTALLEKGLVQLLADLAPTHVEYHALKQLLLSYLDQGKKIQWIGLPQENILKVGMHHDDVPILRQRLQQSGDFISTRADPSQAYINDWFDIDLDLAVKHFQARHGLEEDGVVGGKTREVINISLAQRLQQIILNMERWRWLPRDLPERHIRVNVAGYFIEAYEQHRIKHHIKAIIGRLDRSTPMFQKDMTHVVFNPYWVVPFSIATRDILPKLRKNRSYFYEEKLQLLYKNTPISPRYVNWHRYGKNHFPYRFRQLPGKHNALGQIKFMFPNRFNIYLHDTHHPELFSKAERTFSSGCVRVADPLTLADYVFSKETKNWSKPLIQAMMDKEKTRTINLEHPIPVYILYWTVWINEQGLAQFRNDIYGHDQLLADAFHLSYKQPIAQLK